MDKKDIELITWGFEKLLEAVPKMAIDIFKLNELALVVRKLEKENQ